MAITALAIRANFIGASPVSFFVDRKTSAQTAASPRADKTADAPLYSHCSCRMRPN
jgi:hypothetical protein